MIAGLRPWFGKTANRCSLVSLASRSKSSITSTSTSSFSEIDQIYNQALDNANNFDSNFNYKHQPRTVDQSVRTLLKPIRPQLSLSDPNGISLAHVPDYIARPPYAHTGNVPPSPHHVILQDDAGIDALRISAKLARKVLDKTCSIAKPGITTDEINTMVHQFIVEEGAYPSPLNYAGFPKSVCSSVNEVVCHGIPDGYKLQKGDVASFDVSLFFNGYHGDNCATVLVGDENTIHSDDSDSDSDTNSDSNSNDDSMLSFHSKEEELLFITGRRLIQATQESLDMAITTCRSGSCLTDIGAAVAAVADAYGYDSVEKYRGHGIGTDFHCPPFVKHYRNKDYLELQEGMVFTIEPMITEGNADCVEWQSDGWTVVTKDGGRSAQFEHMVAITSDGAEILTVPS
jgi:methionyl aminopeptidase